MTREELLSIREALDKASNWARSQKDLFQMTDAKKLIEKELSKSSIPSEDLEEAVEQQIEDFAGCVPSDDCKVDSTYLDRISWIKEKFRYFYNLGKRKVEYLYSKSPCEVDEAARAYTGGSISDEAAFEVAAFKAGAEWLRAKMPMPEDTVLFNKGVAEGRRLERQDMLKDAVEGEVIEDLHGQRYVKSEAVDGTKFKFGDKVKIVIVPIKEDKK